MGEETPDETPEQKRERVLRRLAEILRADPPDLSGLSDLSGAGGGPVSAGGLPVLPSTASEFDQESAAELFAALGRVFELRHKPAEDEKTE